jgi:pyridoxamine 5'-phosphate oxidase
MATDHPNEHRDYDGLDLSPEAIVGDPLAQLATWIEDGAADVGWEAGAFTLATVDAAGRPDARVVLLRGIDDRGLRFFSNYDSAKGAQLAAAPVAAAVFVWPHRYRQVRVRGPVERLSEAESDAYFATRPRGSQLGAWASRQSSVLASRAALEASYAAALERWDGRDVERPSHWGGYRLVPEEVELWSGRPDRLHDRVRYVREAQDWRTERLAP